jgi:phosphoglycolate phosphatase
MRLFQQTARFFFDLDGTLTDPKPGITRCIQHALTELGEPVPHADDLEWCIGPPLAETFSQLVGDAAVDRAIALYRERFGDVGLFENEIYPGVEDVLAMLAASGHDLFVASSKPQVYVERILGHFGLRRYFRHAFGSELDGTRTHKAELLEHALRETGTVARDATMIGDRSHDAVGAQANGIAFVGVLYGYGSVEEFASLGVERFAGQPAELPGLLR